MTSFFFLGSSLSASECHRYLGWSRQLVQKPDLLSMKVDVNSNSMDLKMGGHIIMALRVYRRKFLLTDIQQSSWNPYASPIPVNRLLGKVDFVKYYNFSAVIIFNYTRNTLI